MKKLFLIAGEPSGDGHGARLVQSLKALDPDLELYGLGGPQMKAAGVKILSDLTAQSALGLTDVLLKYFTFRKIFYEALREVRRIQPDLVVLIDSPGFNLRFAKKINGKIPILYYISPQIWAWGGRRISVIRKYVTQLIVFFPFEKELYDRASVPSTYVGHPLADEIIAGDCGQSAQNPVRVLGLLPGSREKEVKRILPVLLEGIRDISKKYPKIRFLVSESSNIPESVYQEILERFAGTLKIDRLRGKPYEVIRSADLLAVASGTATLETALHGKPFILVYKAAWLSYILGRLLIQVPFLGIVNILAGKPTIPELIQTHLRTRNVFRELDRLISDPQARARQIQTFDEIRKKLSVGNSRGRAAREVLQLLQSQATATASSKNI